MNSWLTLSAGWRLDLLPELQSRADTRLRKSPSRFRLSMNDCSDVKGIDWHLDQLWNFTLVSDRLCKSLRRDSDCLSVCHRLQHHGCNNRHRWEHCADSCDATPFGPGRQIK